ncbi:ABC transporter ATP-binding protein, partial [Streptomyces sp. CC53]|uniref:ABC transporter ATP-binding protein n=1 Tax=Streptomyces sp. CC53 TaxID=1906740 RepID=UPI000A715BCC
GESTTTGTGPGRQDHGGKGGTDRGAPAGAGGRAADRERTRRDATGGGSRTGPYRKGGGGEGTTASGRRTASGPPAGGGGAEPTVRLRARGLTVRYAGFTALDGVDLAVPGGRVTALVGPNGAGKSTLFHCLAGTVRPASGRVTLDGADITRRPAHARTRLGVARTFQEPAVFPSLSVEDNVRVGAEQGRVRDTPGVATEQALRLLGLDGPLRARSAAGLSTGALRRTELARVLAGRPHTLLLDEPAAGLDTAETAALARVLTALAADGLAVLVVEHDPDLVAEIAHTVHVMEAGRIVS